MCKFENNVFVVKRGW